MNKQIKEAINRISECNMLMAIDCLGDLIDDIIFQNEKSAILIDNNKKTMHLLFSCSINNQKRLELILILTELLAVLDYLEMRQLIYVQYEANTDGIIFYYEGKKCFEADQIPDNYKISQDVLLQIREDDAVLYSNKREIMNSIQINDNIALSLSKYLNSRILPTAALRDYVNNGFRTNEERNTHLGLRYSLISMAIAVFVAALSPAISVMISNRFGVTTINESQIDSLINSCKSIDMSKDDIAICGEIKEDSLFVTE